MTTAGVPARLAEVIEGMRRASGDPEAVGQHAEAMMAIQADMVRIAQEPHEGVSESGRCTVVGTVDGDVQHVQFDGSLTMRPSPADLEKELRSALAASRTSALEGMRQGYRDHFGIEIPDVGQEHQTPVVDPAHAEQAFADPLLGDQLRRAHERMTRFLEQEFTGEAPPSTIVITADKSLVSLSFDRMGLRDLDNDSVGKSVTDAWRAAQEALEDARRQALALDLGEFDPELTKAKALAALDEAQGHLRNAQL